MIASTAFRTDPTSSVKIVIGGQEVTTTLGWVASQDVLMLGDPFSVELPNPRGRLAKKITEGASVELHLSNPSVRGGAFTLTHTGVVTDVELSSEMGSGSVIRVQGADRGWHLTNNCPPFLLNGRPQLIEHVSLYDLIRRFASVPSWGFADAAGNVEIRTDDVTSRLIRQGLPPTRAQAQALASDDLIVYRAIVEPGQAVADLLTSAARRLNRLIGVSADGVLQVFNPDYAQTPRYRIDYHHADDPDSVRNNVVSCSVQRSLASRWSRVEVVGQVVGWYPLDPNDLAPGRFSSAATQDGVPVERVLTYADGDVWDPRLAPYAAQWRLNREAYEAFTGTYKLRAHHQGGTWWTAGTMCELHDSVNGIDGNFFVASVQLMRTRDGDQTVVTLKEKDLLAASFDRLPPR